MKNIETYELHRAGWSILVILVMTVLDGLCVRFIENGTIFFMLCIISFIVACLCINALFNFYGKKIEKYKKEHADELSLDSFRL